MVNSLLPEKVKIAAFYLQPKIHKHNNPERLVNSSVDYHTRISQIVDHYPYLVVTNLKLYMKDTNDFIKRKESSVT